MRKNIEITKIAWQFCLIVICLGFIPGVSIHAQTPATAAFSYQGQVAKDGVAYNGFCDFEFELFDAASNGSSLGSQSITNLTVSNGVFTAKLNDQNQFGDVFQGDARWLEIAIRCPPGSGVFTVLSPRQEILSTPYAQHTLSANDNLTLPFDGTISTGTAVFSVRNTSNVNFSSALAGFADNSGSFGVYGASSQGQGVRGQSGSGHGVVGTSESGDGVRGTTQFGQSGVYGKNNGTAAQSTGVWGRSDAAGTYGVYGSSAAGQAVVGVSTSGTGVTGTSQNGQGVRGFTQNGAAGVYGIENGLSGISADNSGVRGESITHTGVNGLSSSGLGVVGASTSGVGVYGTTTTGFAMQSNGPARQNIAAGGWVKAMVMVAEDGTILRCFNSQATGILVNSGGCGFSTSTDLVGHRSVHFGFDISQSFALVTVHNCSDPDPCFLTEISQGSTLIGVYTRYVHAVSGPGDHPPTWAPFTLVLF